MMRPPSHRPPASRRAEAALVFALRVWIAAAMLLAPVIAFVGGAAWCAVVIGWLIRLTAVSLRVTLP